MNWFLVTMFITKMFFSNSIMINLASGHLVDLFPFVYRKQYSFYDVQSLNRVILIIIFVNLVTMLSTIMSFLYIKMVYICIAIFLLELMSILLWNYFIVMSYL